MFSGWIKVKLICFSIIFLENLKSKKIYIPSVIVDIVYEYSEVSKESILIYIRSFKTPKIEICLLKISWIKGCYTFYKV
jgi:hypothetical protein